MWAGNAGASLSRAGARALLAPAAERLGVEKVYKITNRELLPQSVSDVFDGRYVFGPTGALRAKRVPPREFGLELEEYVRLPSYKPKVEGASIEATVIHVDGFGNIVTNVTYDMLEAIGIMEGSEMSVRFSGVQQVLPYVRSFSEVPSGSLLLLVAGEGYLEVAVNQGDAHEATGLRKGDRMTLGLPE